MVEHASQLLDTVDRRLYLGDLSLQVGECGFFCPHMGQFHSSLNGSPYCPVFPINFVVLAQPYMGRLSLYVENVNVLSQYLI